MTIFGLYKFSLKKSTLHKDIETYLSFEDNIFGLFIYYKNKFNIQVFTDLDSLRFINRFKPLNDF